MGALIGLLPKIGRGLQNSMPRIFQAIGIGTTGAVISSTNLPAVPDPSSPAGRDKLFLWGFIALIVLLILKK
jgi:hypothetical protein